MENYTDSQLIGMYLEGKQRAFDGLVNRHTQSIYSFVFNLTRSPDESRDIVQETFIKAWRNIRKFDNKRKFKTWIFTIAQRTTIDYFRKRKNINFSELYDDEKNIKFEETIPDEELNAIEIFEQTENILLVKYALEKLSFENRVIVLLHNGEEMTFAEIAEVLNKPINTIKSTYRRSLISIKEAILNKNAPKL